MVFIANVEELNKPLSMPFKTEIKNSFFTKNNIVKKILTKYSTSALNVKVRLLKLSDNFPSK